MGRQIEDLEPRAVQSLLMDPAREDCCVLTAIPLIKPQKFLQLLASFRCQSILSRAQRILTSPFLTSPCKFSLCKTVQVLTCSGKLAIFFLIYSSQLCPTCSRVCRRMRVRLACADSPQTTKLLQVLEYTVNQFGSAEPAALFSCSTRRRLKLPRQPRSATTSWVSCKGKG